MPDLAQTTPPRQSYLPKIATTFAEGYRLADLRKDAAAGLTVAIVALPLSMAIAVASGVSPDRGLYAAIVGGFLVSALGGSRYQIGGPAGAFIVLVAATVAKFGVDGLLLAVLLSGAMLSLLGALRLGSLIRHIPQPVIVGFTCGIAVTIFATQIKDLLGLSLSGAEPGPLIPKLAALAGALPSLNPAAAGLSLAVIAVILGLKRLRPAVPGMLVAVAAASAAAALMGLPVETIGTRFGGIPSGLPLPQLPEITTEKLVAILPAAFSFTLLGGVESLLSAMVADGMAGSRHRSNMELIAQGVANIASALFGGISVTGTIARTATNIRAGGRTPVAGMLHALFLLMFMVLAAPLASYIPLAALAGVLAVVAWTMAERREFANLLKTGGPAVVLLTTFVLTVLHDLTAGILAGCAVAVLLWLPAAIARARRS